MENLTLYVILAAVFFFPEMNEAVTEVSFMSAVNSERRSAFHMLSFFVAFALYAISQVAELFEVQHSVSLHCTVNCIYRVKTLGRKELLLSALFIQ